MLQRGELIPVQLITVENSTLVGTISIQTVFLELQASEPEPGEKEKEEAETK